MAKKPKPEPGALPLISKHWARIEWAVALLGQQTDDEDMALADLNQMLRDGRLHLKWRVGDEHKLLTENDLAGVTLGRWPNGKIGWGKVPRGGAVFCWKPDLSIFTSVETPPQTAAAETKPAPADKPQLRRGPATTHEWFAICGEIAARCHDKTGRVRVPAPGRQSKLAEAVLQWCGDKYDRQPALSEMRKAVKAVCAALEPLQK